MLPDGFAVRCAFDHFGPVGHGADVDGGEVGVDNVGVGAVLA